MDITISADDLRDTALALGITDAEFSRAANKAIKITQRTLFRLSLSRLAKATGARSDELRKRRRITGYVRDAGALIRFNTDPISLSAFPPSAVRQIPKGFRIPKLGRPVWQRATAPLTAPYEGRPAGFKKPGGQPDTIQKIYRRIAAEGAEIIDRLGDEADELLNKNFTREINQIIRRKTKG
jgi:hypothetical protein